LRLFLTPSLQCMDYWCSFRVFLRWDWGYKIWKIDIYWTISTRYLLGIEEIYRREDSLFIYYEPSYDHVLALIGLVHKLTNIRWIGSEVDRTCAWNWSNHPCLINTVYLEARRPLAISVPTYMHAIQCFN
jgi:hypothetical protein